MLHAQVRKVATGLLVVMMPAISLALDPPQDKSKPENSRSEKKASHDDALDVIAVASVGIRLSYGDAHRFAVESNLTGQKPLPPGIRKNLARGKPMPPGIAQTRAPSSFLKRLPVHEDYEWQIAGTDLVLVLKSEMSIAGVLKGVFD